MDVKGIQFAENDGRGRWLYRGSIEVLSRFYRVAVVVGGKKADLVIK